MKGILGIVVLVLMSLLFIGIAGSEVFTYTGNTGSGLATFVSNNGAGTYHAVNDILVTSQVNIPVDQVRFEDIEYTISMPSGNAIYNTGNGIEYEGCTIRQYNTDTSVNCLVFHNASNIGNGVVVASPQVIDTVVYNYGSGIGISLYNPWISYIKGSSVNGYGHSQGIGIKYDGTRCMEPHLTDVNVDHGYYGIYIAGIQGVYGQRVSCTNQFLPLAIDPSSDYMLCSNILFSDSRFDVGYSGGEAVTVGWVNYPTPVGLIQTINFDNCDIVGSSAGISVMYGKYITISRSRLSSIQNCLYLYSYVDRALLTDSTITSFSQSVPAICSSGDNVLINGNGFTTSPYTAWFTDSNKRFLINFNNHVAKICIGPGQIQVPIVGDPNYGVGYNSNP
jgi:hypothetical protein